MQWPFGFENDERFVTVRKRTQTRMSLLIGLYIKLATNAERNNSLVPQVDKESISTYARELEANEDRVRCVVQAMASAGLLDADGALVDADAVLPDVRAPSAQKSPSKQAVADAMIQIYNEERVSPLPKAMKAQGKRRDWLYARYMHDLGQSFDAWRQYCRRVAQSSFLTGNKIDFCATIDWIARPNNFVAVMEGQYDDRARQQVDSVHAAADALERVAG